MNNGTSQIEVAVAGDHVSNVGSFRLARGESRCSLWLDCWEQQQFSSCGWSIGVSSKTFAYGGGGSPEPSRGGRRRRGC